MSLIARISDDASVMPVDVRVREGAHPVARVVLNNIDDVFPVQLKRMWLGWLFFPFSCEERWS